MAQERVPYANLIGEVIVDGLSPIFAPIDIGSSPWVNATICERQVISRFQDVDWDGRAAELPPQFRPDDPNENTGLAKHDIAQHLTRIAFTDAKSLISMADKYLYTHTPPREVSDGQILLNSGRTLLSIARLPDDYKGDLFEAISRPYYAKAFVGIEIPDSAMTIRRDTAGTQLLDWIPAVKQWIHGRVEPDRGCPASTQVVEVGGARMTLMNFFWDKLVRAGHEI